MTTCYTGRALASKITSIGNPPSTSSMVHAVGVLCCCVCPACLLVPLLLNACSCCALIHGGEGTAGGVFLYFQQFDLEGLPCLETIEIRTQNLSNIIKNQSYVSSSRAVPSMAPSPSAGDLRELPGGPLWTLVGLVANACLTLRDPMDCGPLFH